MVLWCLLKQLIYIALESLISTFYFLCPFVRLLANLVSHKYEILDALGLERVSTIASQRW